MQSLGHIHLVWTSPPFSVSRYVAFKRLHFQYAFVLPSNCHYSLHSRKGVHFLQLLLAVTVLCVSLRNGVQFIFVLPWTNLFLFQFLSRQYLVLNMMHPTSLNDEVVLKQRDKNVYFKHYVTLFYMSVNNLHYLSLFNIDCRCGNIENKKRRWKQNGNHTHVEHNKEVLS